MPHLLTMQTPRPDQEENLAHPSDPPDDNKHNLLGFEESSRQHWREVSVRKAADFLRTSLLDQLDFPSPAKRKFMLDVMRAGQLTTSL